MSVDSDFTFPGLEDTTFRVAGLVTPPRANQGEAAKNSKDVLVHDVHGADPAQTPAALGLATMARLLAPPDSGGYRKQKQLPAEQQRLFDAAVHKLGGMPAGARIGHITSPQGERYIMLSREGQGAYGAFRLAMRVSDGQVLAAKVLRLDTHPDAALPTSEWLRKRGDKREPTAFSSWQTAQNEIGLAKKVKSPLAPVALVNDRQKHKLYMFSELCHSDFIDLYMSFNAPPPDADTSAAEQRLAPILHLLSQVAKPLVDLHNAGVVHRDIKLDNIFLARDGKVHLADFGLATMVGADGKVSGYAGTPGFLGPEAYSGRSYDGRYDMFGLGAAVVHFLLGATPFGEAGDGSFTLRNKAESWERFFAGAPKDAGGRIITGAFKNFEAAYGMSPVRRFAKFINELHALYPSLANLVVNDLLHPDYSKRISARGLQSAMARLQPPAAARSVAVRKELADLAAADPDRAHKFAVMDAYRKTVFPEAATAKPYRAS